MRDFPSASGRRAQAGRYLGIGIGNGMKGTGRGPFESGIVRIGRSGPHLGLYRRDADGTGDQDRAGADLRRAIHRRARRRHGRGRRHRGHSLRPGRLRQPPDDHRGLRGASRGASRCATKALKVAAHLLEASVERPRDARRPHRDRRRSGQRSLAARDRRSGVGRAGLCDAGRLRARARRAWRASCRAR